MDLVNTIAKDDLLLPPRGFQVTGLRVDDDDLITGERPLRRLANGTVIVYVDRWEVTVVVCGSPTVAC